MSFVKNTFEEIINTDHKVITEESSKTILKKYGVKVPGFALAKSADEAANGPTLPEADPIIYKKKIMVIPNILANSGGVCISYLEWVQNNMGYYWSFDEVAGKMEANIVRGLKDSHDISKKYKIDMRRAAMVLAVQRVMEAFEHKGIWP